MIQYAIKKIIITIQMIGNNIENEPKSIFP